MKSRACSRQRPGSRQGESGCRCQDAKYISTGKSRNKFGVGLDRAAEVYARAAQLPTCDCAACRPTSAHRFLKPIRSPRQPQSSSARAELRDQYGIDFFSIAAEWVSSMIRLSQAAIPNGGNPPIIPSALPRRLCGGDLADLEAAGHAHPFRTGSVHGGNAGVLLSTVQYVKKTPAKTFTIVDAQ